MNKFKHTDLDNSVIDKVNKKWNQSSEDVNKRIEEPGWRKRVKAALGTTSRELHV